MYLILAIHIMTIGIITGCHIIGILEQVYFCENHFNNISSVTASKALMTQ